MEVGHRRIILIQVLGTMDQTGIREDLDMGEGMTRMNEMEEAGATVLEAAAVMEAAAAMEEVVATEVEVEVVVEAHMEAAAVVAGHMVEAEAVAEVAEGVLAYHQVRDQRDTESRVSMKWHDQTCTYGVSVSRSQEFGMVGGDFTCKLRGVKFGSLHLLRGHAFSEVSARMNSCCIFEDDENISEYPIKHYSILLHLVYARS